MATYSAADVIGKNLIAKKQVVAFVGSPNSKNIFVVPAGNNIGTVYSWIQDGEKSLWWEFDDSKMFGKGIFFVKHGANLFDVTALRDQGLISDGEKNEAAVEAKKKEDMGAFAYYAQKWGGKILAVTAVTVVAVAAIKTYNGNKRTDTRTQG